MSGLLDDSRYTGDVAADSGTVLSVPPTMTWIGPLPAGDTVEITYSVLLGEAGSGDGSIVNVVRLAGLGLPSETVQACPDTAAGNAGVTACAVTLQLDTRSLAHTGVAVSLLALLGTAFAAVALGIAFVVRRRRRAGDAVAPHM